MLSIGFIEFGVEKFLLKVAYEQIGKGGGHMGAHGHAMTWR